ncbi:PAP2-domain-containing protein, partial [Ramicandelaber brevisporus]
LDITHVRYRDGDQVGKLLAHITLFPIFLVVAYLTLIIARRELIVCFMFTGQILNEVVNAILKRNIRQARPTTYLGEGYGMPSSHSQFMGYAAAFAWLAIWRRFKGTAPVWKVWYSVVVTAVSVAVLYSRVYLKYHTVEQVIVGGTLGVAAGAVWYGYLEYVLHPIGLVDYVLTHPVVEWFNIRDSLHVSEVIKEEHSL